MWKKLTAVALLTGASFLASADTVQAQGPVRRAAYWSWRAVSAPVRAPVRAAYWVVSRPFAYFGYDDGYGY